MRPPRSRPPRAPAATPHAYPEHLRPDMEALPQVPGVYIFHGQAADWPVYIGKSVNLRSRVQAHLRNPDEARMLQQTTRISHIPTAGEVGALLLEARLIKQQQPLFNQKLRRNRQLCALRLDADDRPVVVHAQDIDFATTPGLFGLYASRTAALEGLRQLADTHALCYGALGLEKPSPGRGCFRAMLRQCAGVCCGRESPQAHAARLRTALEALRVNCWPYPGAVGLVERRPTAEGAFTQIHVVRNWCYLGTVATAAEAQALTTVAAGFDADGYKILCPALLAQRVEVLPL
ncbi:excinuclease Cho [Aquabacterium sp. A08]|uniref:excinuclease Cho n=1 Tax=Aquabacterium sp. A08 TaxID=2718532 RepID=UPI00141ECB7A|nr:excinuclease Cho [Aquabacterium sp. A08]NIC43657.1 excinuclease Cho [Aquabacterium sp. A08]